MKHAVQKQIVKVIIFILILIKNKSQIYYLHAVFKFIFQWSEMTFQF